MIIWRLINVSMASPRRREGGQAQRLKNIGFDFIFSFKLSMTKYIQDVWYNWNAFKVYSGVWILVPVRGNIAFNIGSGLDFVPNLALCSNKSCPLLSRLTIDP